MDERGNQRRPGHVAQAAYRGLGVVAMALAAVGLAVPGLPATPFLLVALWAFSRGAPEWADRLRAHPRYGPLVRNWEERRAIPRSAKVAAVVGIVASWALLALATRHLVVALGAGLLLAGVIAYIVTRPSE